MIARPDPYSGIITYVRSILGQFFIQREEISKGVDVKLSGRLIERSELENEQIDRMFFLMDSFYRNVSRTQFETDLEEKKWVVVVENHEKTIQGFTTITTIETKLEERDIVLFFSGDTIIHKNYWGSTVMHKIWAKFVLGMASYKDQSDCYWLLLSKGYKTYRLLSTYMNHFYPCFNEPAPVFEKQIIDWFGAYRYPDNYDKENGVVVFNGSRDYLAHGIADITPQRLKDPHVKFFAEVNPGHILGDELVCIARLSGGNVTPFVRRHYLD